MARVEKLLQLAKQNFEEGEEILSFVDGAFQTTVNNKNSIRTGVLIATNEKVRFCGKRLFFIFDDIIEYKDIYDIELSEEKLGYTIFINGKKKSYFMKFIISTDVKRFVAILKENKGKRK